MKLLWDILWHTFYPTSRSWLYCGDYGRVCRLCDSKHAHGPLVDAETVPKGTKEPKKPLSDG